MANKYVFSKCHPDSLHVAKGLCGPCYAKQNHAANREARLAQMRVYNRDVRHDRRKRRPAPCHLSRPHYAKGLCEPCYQKSAHAVALRAARYRLRAGVPATMVVSGVSYPVRVVETRDTPAPAPAKSASSFFRRPK